MASYESLLPEIIPMVSSCPDTLIENSIRSATIELCEKAKVYQVELDPITAIANLFEYDLEPPSGTVVHEILWATYDGKDLEPITSALLEQRLPQWRQAGNQSTPEYFVKQSQSLFYLAPVPNETKPAAVLVRAIVKPTHTSTSCSNDVMNDYRDTIINGALLRLLRLPGREWTDYAGAGVYSALFNEGIVEAEKRGRQTETRVTRKVAYGGLGKNYRLTRTKYSRG